MLALACACAPHFALAQAYKASVLYSEPAESTAAPAGISAPEPEPPRTPAFHAPSVRRSQPIILAPILGSLAGGIGLAYAGLALGYAGNPNTQDISVGAIAGFVLGEMIGVPLGAHLGNGRRGNFAGDLGISVLTGLAGIGLGSLDSGGGAYLLGAAGQIALTIANERATARRRLAREAAAAP
ncbi:MAG: hypothetical protein ABI960_10975 [Candidatus Eisenbacteria bacterium]